jgi:hypothetical protein
MKGDLAEASLLGFLPIAFDVPSAVTVRMLTSRPPGRSMTNA